MNTKHCPDCHTRMVKVGHTAKWWSCPKCGATAPLRKTATKKPDTSLRLDAARRAWLIEKYGGVQPGVKRLIDDAMNSADKPGKEQDDNA